MKLSHSVHLVKELLSEKSNISVAAWMFILISGYSVTAGALLLCPIRDILLNIAFQFFLMTIPGLAVTKALFSDKHDPILSAGLSYAFGYMIVIIEYLLVMPFGREFSLPVALLVFLLSCTLLWWKKKELIIRHPDEEVHSGYLLVFWAVLITSFFCYSVKTGGAGLTEVIAMPTDTQYWLSNASALSVSFPPQNPRFAGDTLYYYYFSSILLAFQSNTTGMSVYSLGTVFYSLPKALLLFGGVYSVLSSLKLNHKSITFGLIAVIFSTGFEFLTVVTNTSHMMLSPFGFDIGIGCCCWMLYFVIEQYHKAEFDYKLCMGAVLFMAAACGTKAPSAIIFMIAAGIVCFGWLFGKEYKKAFSFGLGLLLAFALIMYTFVISPNVDGASDIGGLHPKQLFLYGDLSSLMYNYSLSKIYPEFLILPTVICFFLIADPLPSFFGMVGILHIAKWKKSRTSVYIGLAISILSGTFMGLFWTHPGKSNMYYSMTVRVLAIIFGVCLFDKEIAKAKLCVSRSFASLLSVLLFFQVYLFFFVGYNEGCFNNIRGSTLKLFSIYTNNEISESDDLHTYFGSFITCTNREKVEALSWIRNNTEKDSLIATPEGVSDNPDSNTYNYLYSPIFSERNVYMEGCVYMRAPSYQVEISRRNDLMLRTYQNDREALLQLKEEGVDYIICDRRAYPLFEPEPDFATHVYHSDRIDVYNLI